MTITVQAGGWPPGVYAARLTTEDGRVGFAPFVLAQLETEPRRQLIVMPTNTWQAYNFYDRDGDGWGDTWYAGGSPPVDLTAAVPGPRRAASLQDLRPCLPPLARTHRKDAGLRGRRRPRDVRDGRRASRASTTSIVFPGHSEYMTTHAYDVIERYRDLGGRLVFLSANNFFWKVETDGSTMRRVKLWRELGRPEARLLGVQYRANDDGRRQGPYTVVAAEAAPWLFDKTGLVNGSTFGETVGGYGIEIDMATPDSPPGTIVLARVVDLFGPGLSGEMTYYETEAGARVFSAGTLDFGGSATFWPISGCSTNLWTHMLADVVAASGLSVPTPVRRLVAARRERRKANTANGITASVPAATSRKTECGPDRLEERPGDEEPDGPGEHGQRDDRRHHLRSSASGVRIVITPISGALIMGPKSAEIARARTTPAGCSGRTRNQIGTVIAANATAPSRTGSYLGTRRTASTDPRLTESERSEERPRDAELPPKSSYARTGSDATSICENMSSGAMCPPRPRAADHVG